DPIEAFREQHNIFRIDVESGGGEQRTNEAQVIRIRGEAEPRLNEDEFHPRAMRRLLSHGQQRCVMFAEKSGELSTIVDALVVHDEFAVAKEIPLLAAHHDRRQALAGVGDHPLEMNAARNRDRATGGYGLAPIEAAVVHVAALLDGRGCIRAAARKIARAGWETRSTGPPHDIVVE